MIKKLLSSWKLDRIHFVLKFIPLIFFVLLFFVNVCAAQGIPNNVNALNAVVKASDTLTDQQLVMLFRRINRSDQSNLDYPDERRKIFKANFDTIVSVTRTQGFPNFKVKPKRKKDRKSINVGTSMTFIHILQTQPEEMLNSEIIILFKQELEEKRLDKDLLNPAMQILYYHNCKGELLLDPETQKMFDLAVVEWGIVLQENK